MEFFPVHLFINFTLRNAGLLAKMPISKNVKLKEVYCLLLAKLNTPRTVIIADL